MIDPENGPYLVTEPDDAVTALRCPHLQPGFNVNRTGAPADPAPARPHPPLSRVHTRDAVLVFSDHLALALTESGVAPSGPDRAWAATTLDLPTVLAAPVSLAAVAALHPHIGSHARASLAAAASAWVDALGPVIAADRTPRRFSLARRRERTAHASLLRELANLPAASTGTDRARRTQAAVLAAAIQVPIAAGAWLLTLLAHHPDVQRAIADERALGSRGHSPRAPRPWAECAAWETLRLYPPTWLLPRTATQDLPLAGTTVRAGQDVLVSPFLLGRRPELIPPPPELPDPTAPAPPGDGTPPALASPRTDLDDFAPTRWRDPTTRPGRWLPFGAGVHACPGRSMALLLLGELAGQMSEGLRLSPPQTATRICDRRGLMPEPTTVTVTPRPSR